MKNLYINSRLHPLLVGSTRNGRGRDWIFSRGESWLLLTPARLAALADRLGLADGRVHRLIGLIRRHSDRPNDYCRRLGIRETVRLDPKDYPLVSCPRCDGIHQPHPEDAGMVCAECREQEQKAIARRPPGGAMRDRQEDRLARDILFEKSPGSFDEGVLSPNFQYNLKRRLHRDWDKAINRILMGHTYRQVSREFDCSVGLLHRKVKEHRNWENN